MSLDKAILHGKEHRKPYYGSKQFDSTCRNHGSCLWCKNNRLFNNHKRLIKSIEEIELYKYSIIKW